MRTSKQLKLIGTYWSKGDHERIYFKAENGKDDLDFAPILNKIAKENGYDKNDYYDDKECELFAKLMHDWNSNICTYFNLKTEQFSDMERGQFYNEVNLQTALKFLGGKTAQEKMVEYIIENAKKDAVLNLLLEVFENQNKEEYRSLVENFNEIFYGNNEEQAAGFFEDFEDVEKEEPEVDLTGFNKLAEKLGGIENASVFLYKLMKNWKQI